MDVREELTRFRQITEALGIAGAYHFVRRVGMLVDDEGEIDQRVAQLLARHLLRHFDLTVTVIGVEHVAGLTRYAIAATHASYLDWAVLLGYFPAPVRFVAKRELVAFPVIGSYLRRRGILIDRRHGVGAKEAIAGAVVDAEPWPILIFPEGTRSRDGTIAPFKPGGLAILAAAGRPIVPVCITGTHAAFARDARTVRRGGRIELRLGAPVLPNELGVAAAVAEVERRVRVLAAG